MNIVIIGAGELGQAIATLLSKKDVHITLWDADASKVANQKSLAEILPIANAVFFCIPSWVIEKAIEEVTPYLPKQCILVSFAKGIEGKTGKTMPELFAEKFPDHEYAIISGPMLAEEISEGKSAIGVIATTNDTTRRTLQNLFSSPQFKAELSNKPFDVAIAGTLKNIYAVALGIADGLELSGNEKGWLVSQAINEMALIGEVLAVDTHTILTTAGVADLIATGYSEFSRNRQVGDEIVRNGSCKLPGEGLMSLPPLLKRIDEKGTHLPLLSLINAVGIECKPAKELFQLFFNGEKN